MKNVMRFGKKGKLSPKYVGPFEVLEKVGGLAYRVELAPKFEKIHNVFHVSCDTPFSRVLLTTVNLRKTCVSHIMRPIHE